jgi:hypothetical protein
VVYIEAQFSSVSKVNPVYCKMRVKSEFTQPRHAKTVSGETLAIYIIRLMFRHGESESCIQQSACLLIGKLHNREVQRSIIYIYYLLIEKICSGRDHKRTFRLAQYSTVRDGRVYIIIYVYNLIFKSCPSAPYRLIKASETTVDIYNNI